MNPRALPVAWDANDEVLALIKTLHDNGQRLEELTAGEVDTVSDRDGRTFVLLQAQEHLRHVEAAKQAAILNALPAHIALLDPRGQIISVNEAWSRFARTNVLQAPGSGIGLNYLEICDEAMAEEASEAREAAEGIRSVLGGHADSYSLEYACHGPAEQRWFLLTVTPLPGNPPQGAVVMHLNVTEQRQAKDDLRESELRLRQLAENVKAVFFLVDPIARRTLYVSPGFEEIWGRSIENAYARATFWADSIVPEDRARVLAQRYADGGMGKFETEFRIARPDGSVRWIRSRGFPIRDEAGQVYRIAGIAEDFTEKKRAQQALQESERRYGDMLGNVRLVSIMLDLDGTISYCNDHLLRLTGWERDEVVGRSWFDQFIPPPLSAVREIFTELLKGEQGARHFENEILTRAGERLLIRWNNTVLRSISGEVVGTASIGEDITEQIRLGNALLESDAGLRRAQELARLAHIVTRSDGSFESWSDTAPGLIGGDEATMPRSVREWVEIVHPDDRAGFRAAEIECGSRKERTQLEYRVKRGDFERHILQVMEPIQGSLGADGRMRWFSTLQDMTEHKRAEAQVRGMNADLERRVAERTSELEAANKELEVFDYSISHDLRAPINRIEGFSAILGEQYGEKLDARGRDLLQRIAQAGRSMDQLVGDLFALSTVGRGELQRSPVDVSALAESIGAILRKSEPQREVRLDVPAGMAARADPGLLRIVLENLLGNAWKFTKGRALAHIEVGYLEVGGEHVYSVRDNGAGFDMAGADKLFTPFQRLHSPSQFEGTGIGLATVQRIVRRHGGRVWADAAVGQGATFCFTLSA